MRKQYKISTAKELIQFIKETNLSYDQYSEIIKAFYNRNFIALGEVDINLIDFIEKCESYLCKGWDLPISFYQKGKHFSIKDIYSGAE